MSSTTEHARERGQVLVLFAGSLVVLFLIAALAFDVGMTFLERRDQQNGADAAALAGARYVASSSNYSGSCAGGAGNAAVVAACQVALANDFDNSAADENVFVHIPPVDGQYRGFPGFVQVRIDATRSAIFAGVMGRTNWAVGANAVAANQPGITYSFGMLALDPDACKAIQISGSGVVNANSNVQSNSTGAECGDPDDFGLSRTGSGVLNLTAPDAVCRSAGDIQDQGSGSMTCARAPYSFALPDPLANLPAPPKPLASATPALVPVGHSPNSSQWPDWCPGTTSTTKPFDETKNKPCEVDKAWIFGPGIYPGGISVKGPNAVAYLLPGIYWLGGGGFSTSNNGTVISVAAGATASTLATCHGNRGACAAAGGVLLYNASSATAPAGSINLGGGGANLKLLPYEYPLGASTIDLAVFQARDVCANVEFNGSDSNASEVRGIVYVPCGQVVVNGGDSIFNVDQVIAGTFKINGSGGTINVLRESGVDAEISGVGLVE